MKFSEWEPTYRAICADMGFSPDSDSQCVRILKAVTMNSDLCDEDAIIPLIKSTVSVVGDAPCLEQDLSAMPLQGTVICSGSAVLRLLKAGIRPDIVVTDLDGNINAQLSASSEGAVTLILAHGDNMDLVQKYASFFQGPVVLTTQGEPSGTVFNFGGFTDGDRCVCLAREFGAGKIILYGFDFDNPNPKEGSDPEVKLRKLKWAEKIIYANGGADIVLPGRNEEVKGE